LREKQNLTWVEFVAPADMPNLLLYHKFPAFSNFQRSRHVIETQLLQLSYKLKFDGWAILQLLFAAAIKFDSCQLVCSWYIKI
jgi:hypothetical protein